MKKRDSNLSGAELRPRIIEKGIVIGIHLIAIVLFFLFAF